MSDVHIIKKYSNRRLYDTNISAHITLHNIRNYVVEEIAFRVFEASSGIDITRNVLLQIIREAEAGEKPIFSEASLKDVIRFYGPFQRMFGDYLEKNFESMVAAQKEVELNDLETWLNLMKTQMPSIEKIMSEYLKYSRRFYKNTQNTFDISSSHYSE